MWAEFPHSNIGLIMGEAEGIWALDVDGMEGPKTLEALESGHGQLPPTWTFTTGGGYQMIFRWPEKDEIKSLSRVLPGIDTRGNGGYSVVPPSQHINGRQYRWAPGHAPHETPLVSAPEWLIQLVTHRRRGAVPQRGGNGYVLTTHPSPVEPGKQILQGVRTRTLLSRGVHLRDRGVARDVATDCIFALNQAFCVPPKPASEVYEIIRSVFERQTIRPCRAPGPHYGDGSMRLHEWLWTRARGEKWTAATEQEMAAAVRVSGRQIRSCIKSLEEWGLLDVDRAPGKKSQFRPRSVVGNDINPGSTPEVLTGFEIHSGVFNYQVAQSGEVSGNGSGVKWLGGERGGEMRKSVEPNL